MSSIQKAMLQLIDPLEVRMIAIDGATIRLVVGSELKRFDFETESEARAAFEAWIAKNPTVERGE